MTQLAGRLVTVTANRLGSVFGWPLIAAGLLIAGSGVCCGQQNPGLQSDEFVEAEPAQSKVQPTPLPPATQQFLRGMALMLLPKVYSDDDDWNLHRKVQSGLNVDFQGGELKTSRRWKDVRHGLWKRVDARFVDPAKNFKLQIDVLPRRETHVPRYRIRTSIRVQAVARIQQWTLGARIYSLSADVDASLDLNADLHFRTTVSETGKLLVLPNIETATLQLREFWLRRVSHAKGPGIRETGRMMSGLIRRVVQRKGEKLPDKINRKVEKQPERFEVPGSFLFGLGVNQEELAKQQDEKNAAKNGMRK